VQLHRLCVSFGGSFDKAEQSFRRFVFVIPQVGLNTESLTSMTVFVPRKSAHISNFSQTGQKRVIGKEVNCCLIKILFLNRNIAYSF
jgi:hypothetical protein